jgi:hypothetical protein
VIIALLVMYIFRKINTYKQAGWEGVVDSIRGDAYAAMLWAERKFPDDAGRTKFLRVLDKTYYLLPTEVRKYISMAAYAVILQEWYDQAKDILDDGINNDSNKKVEPG